MAKKSKVRAQTVRPQQPPTQQALAQRRWRLKLVLGGVVLALALGVGGVVRFLQQRDLSPRLQGGWSPCRATAGQQYTDAVHQHLPPRRGTTRRRPRTPHPPGVGSCSECRTVVSQCLADVGGTSTGIPGWPCWYGCS